MRAAAATTRVPRPESCRGAVAYHLDGCPVFIASCCYHLPYSRYAYCCEIGTMRRPQLRDGRAAADLELRHDGADPGPGVPARRGRQRPGPGLPGPPLP